jgi:hypothetical protein
MATRVCCLVCGALLSLTASAQSPSVEELMPRVGAYVRDFVDQFSNVVAEERYEPDPAHRGRQRLRSDYLLVRKPGNDRNFMTFRDVVEVNGRAVGNRNERLAKLFVQPFESAIEQANAITAHSADYIFTASDPLLVMVFLQREYQPRFRFTLDQLDPALGPDVRGVRFLETTSPTILQQPDGQDIVTRGAVWVSEQTGRVVRTELQMGREPSTTTITTVFGRDESLRIDVPAEMHETYFPPRGAFVRGVARYSNFRRFAVTTNEKIDSPGR